jgi:HEPN/Toprim N-terminal domain 1
MMLFRQADKHVQRVPGSSEEARKYLAPRDEGDSPDDDLEIVLYSATSEAIRDRLEFFGYTLDTALEALDTGIAAERVRHRETIEQIRPQLGPEFVDEYGPVLETLTAADWMMGLKLIRDQGLIHTYKDAAELPSQSALVRYMLTHEDGWYGFPGADIRQAIRIAVDLFPGDELVYDLTDLVLAEYFGADDDLIAHSEWLLAGDVASTRSVVILTEGTTDKWILERALKLLYPHMADYYRFMDFEGARVAGGAGALASVVKAFVGAGIVNRTVAIFDNDTAAASAIRGLAAVKVPPNIAVLQYPHLPLAAEYPTIGPTGVVSMDVNGLAGSIELYLGLDVLTLSGELIPVQWKGFDEGVRRYQGEITQKKLVQERFEAKLRQCEARPELIVERNWEGVRMIVDQIRGAFHARDAAALVAEQARPESSLEGDV